MKKSRTMGIMSAIGEWLDAESVSFTAICQEQITHGEVIKTVVGLSAFFMAIGMAGGVGFSEKGRSRLLKGVFYRLI